MDRFVRGEQVPEQELRLAWQDTTQPHTIWDRPIYEEFFRAVRALNSSLPRDRQLRVLLGDPPVDWSRISSDGDYGKLVSDNRNRHPFGLIQREVLSKKRRALIIYGDMHFVRRHALYDYDSSPALDGNSIVTLLERARPSTKVFTIWTNTTADLGTVQADVASWPRPSMAVLRDTLLGTTDFRFSIRLKLLGIRSETANRISRIQFHASNGA